MSHREYRLNHRIQRPTGRQRLSRRQQLRERRFGRHQSQRVEVHPVFEVRIGKKG